MVDTIKFSEMPNAGNINNNDIMPSLRSGANVILNNPWTFLPPGSTADRPTPDATINYRLRFNTDDQLYEYYDAILGAWTQLQESLFTQGPFLIYTADPSIPDGQNLGALANGILKQTISTGVATLNIAVNDIDYYGPGMTGYLQAPAGIKDVNGNTIFVFQPAVSAVNGIGVTNAPTTSNPGFNAIGSDTNVGIGYAAKGNGVHTFYSTAVIPFEIHNGTAYQRVNQFEFADVSGGFTYTFPQASGTIALDTGVATSIIGTQHQVLANGTFGTMEVGDVTLTTPQDIDTTSSPTFAALTVPLFKDANGATALTIQTVATPVNYFNLVPQPTGSGPVIQALGADTDVNLNLQSKGGGIVQFITANPTNPLVLVNGSTAAHITNFIMANTVATRNVTFQDASGTLAFLTDIPSVTPSALTKTDDTNVTLTLGGTPATALLQSVSLTLGWTGLLAQARGGTGFAAFGTGVAAALQLNVGSAGAPVLFNGAGGTPSSMVGTNITGTAAGLTAGSASAVALGGITGLGTGVATALAINTGSAGAFVTFNGAGGTPSSLTLTNATGLPIAGITGLGTGVATALAANVNGSGAIPLITSGSWTPIDGSGAGLSFTGVSGTYVRIGNVVIANCALTYPATANASGAAIAGLPFTSAANQGGTVNYSTSTTLSRIIADASNTTFHLYNNVSVPVTNANMSGSVNIFQIIYTV